MPDIEQLILTLKGGKGDFIPIAELGIHPSIKEKFLGRPVVTIQDDVNFWHTAGYDYIKLQPTVNFNIPGNAGNANLDNSINWAPEGEGIIQTWEDFEKFNFISPENIDYTNFEKVKEYLPEGMGVVGQYGDIFTMAWQLMGFEGFSYALYDNPDLVTAIMDKIGSAVLSMFEYMAQSDSVDAIWYSDDIAYIGNLMLSPQVLRQCFFPWLKKIGQLSKDNGKPLIYHSDGILFDVMEDIISAGVNAIHPVEPKAMDIVEVKKRFGDRLCLIGNLDVGDVLSLGTPEDVKRIVRYNAEHVGHNGGYCIGSGNSVPEYVKFDNYLTLLETAAQINGFI